MVFNFLLIFNFYDKIFPLLSQTRNTAVVIGDKDLKAEVKSRRNRER